ncbi:ATP-binding cassette, subfamily B [Micromonospora phaseoli]|uniref:ATP-binding cassette, subfamily B n=1 Tax=Micromonospora phaseoli TaxID=1144548 RepID=A0A1H7AN67_9ACTN|nr:ATP-binding cassette domain-containing protein [Micromonospora phaseoli]PZV96457.1 ATP-binding cassette subfamily B protein [Micromonospora phaseoli]GIJ76145.1 multidrug ABC transporter permease [Micromonospora phaseoli]SEJ63320.1 ATP-binding cassette, subfamily B [Micromonospora phaseoli]
MAATSTRRRARSDRAGPVTTESVLPELRTMWWETGIRARTEAGLFAVFAELPKLIWAAMRISWQADRLRTSVVAGATVGAGVMSAFGLLAAQRVLVELFAGGPTADKVVAALPALAVLAATTAARSGMAIATGYAMNGLTPRVSREVERGLFEVTTAVRLDAFDADAFADDMERASRGTDSAVDLVPASMNLLAGLVGVIAVAVAVVVIHPLLLPALLVATVPNAWASLRAGHLRYQTYIAGSVRRRRMWLLHRLMAERASAPELRSYGLRRFLLDQYDRVMGVETDIELALARRVTTTITVGSMIGGVATAVVYVLLGLLLIDGQIPLAAAATCVIAVQAAQRSLSVVTYQMDRVYTEGQHFRDYTGFMTRAAAYLPARVAAASPDRLRALAIDAVSLRYPDRDSAAVDRVTLTIEAGQTVAFVGENGSGKSSLAAMIANLRSPTEGVIRWNGRPLPEWDRDELRGRIAVVTQEYHKWPFTAATNIAIGDIDTEAQQDRIEAAAARAVADEMIRELPHGYETLLDRTFAKGQDLSGGQWQRITAARGFLRDAELLVMDEPSSALDPRAEDALFQAIRDRRGRATTILITHRLANVRHADRIFVLHHGRLVEEGTHDELVAVGGRYADLFTLQAAGYADNPRPPAPRPATSC